MAETRSREQTRRRLMDAASELLRAAGPLSGIKLEDVARLAGVTATNVYHYFGDKQGLLRATLQQMIEDGRAFYVEGRNQRLAERRARIFYTAALSDDAAVASLLALDGADVDPMPNLEASIADLRKDVIDGHLDRSHDLEALHTLLVAARHGYGVFREHYAARLDLPVEELDRRVTAFLYHWLESLRPTADHAESGLAADPPAEATEPWAAVDGGLA